MSHLDIQLARQVLEKRLAPEVEQAWLRHAEKCEQCRQLLENERSMMALLDLGDAAAAPAAGMEQLLERVDALNATARRRRVLLTLCSASVVLVLVGLQIWQVRNAPAPRRVETPAELAPALERRLAAQLDGLRALRTDPWIIDEYDAVETFQLLIAEHTEP
jgi:hypothetical protein